MSTTIRAQNSRFKTAIYKILFVVLIFCTPLVKAQFEGDFAPVNWTFSTENADGSIDLTQIPDEITITGGNDNNAGNTDYTIAITQDGELKFSWTYFSTDTGGAIWDPGGYVLNGIFTPLVNTGGLSSQSGTASVTVTGGDEFAFRVYTDDGIFGAGILTIADFAPYRNTPPNIDLVADLYLGIDEAPFDISLTGISSGIAEPGQSINITATSGDPAIIPDPILTYTSPDNNGTLTISPVAAAFGDVIITLTLTDDGGTANNGLDTAIKTFMISLSDNFQPQINAVNNVVLPINSPEKAISLSGINSGKNSNESQIITIEATSSNQLLVADGNISVEYISPDATGTLKFTPESDVTGQATITITVNDGGSTANNSVDQVSTSFVVNINANSAPALDDIADINLNVNTGTQVVNLTGITDGNTNNQTITISATSDNPGLIPDPTVNYTSPDAIGTLEFTSVADQSGEAVITVTVQDDGGTIDGGVNLTTESFVIKVQENFAPTLNDIADIVLPIDAGMQPINLGGITAGNGESQTITVTATSDNTGLIPDPIVTYTSPDINGSIAISPVAGSSGSAIITVTVNDDGGTLNSGVDNVIKTFMINVAGNLPPTINAVNDLSLNKNAGQQTINLSGITAGIGETQSLSVNVTSDNTSLVDNITVNYVDGENTGSFDFTPFADKTGIANIMVTVTDDGGTNNDGIDTKTETFQLRVNNLITYAGAIETGLAFNRPNEDTPPSSTFGNDYYYHVQPFMVNTDGTYFISTLSGNLNTFMVIYENSFEPGAPLDNAISSNDDDPSGIKGIFPVLELYLVKNQQYLLVTTSSNDLETGNFIGEIAGLGEITLGTLPSLDFIEDLIINEDESQSITLSGITDGQGNYDGITVTAQSADIALIDNISPIYNEAEGKASLDIFPNANANGNTTITVVINAAGREFERTFQLTVNPINDNPTFTLDQSDLIVNEGFNGTIQVTATPDPVPQDEDNQVITFSIDPVSVNYATVDIDQFTGLVSFTDFNGNYGTQIFTVTSNDGEASNNSATQTLSVKVNALPTDISISNNAIEEDVAIGTTVGNLSSSDPDVSDTFTYSFVAGPGDNDNNKFTLEGEVLKTATTFDVTDQTAFSIRIQTTDNNGAAFQKIFEINVADVTGLEDLILAGNTSISPNPGKGKFRLQFEDANTDEIKVRVFDLAGKIVFDKTVSTLQHKVDVELDLRKNRNGLYLVKVRTEDGKQVVKRIIKY